MSVPQALRDALEPLTIVCGHYGVGKTNFTLNLALDLAKEGLEVRVVDLDIVNPYFRSSEYTDVLNAAGVEAVTPVMANSSLDTPSLSAAVDGVMEWARGEGRIALVDVGGDDAGATALGRYSHIVTAAPYSLIYVVNAYRNLTQDAAEALQILREIETASHLKATAIVNNSHLRGETDEEVIEGSVGFADEVCKLAELPLVAQTVPNKLTDRYPANSGGELFYPVEMLVKTPWE